jgi:hypothetical protein
MIQVKFKKADDGIHKMTALFYKDAKTKTIHFGAKGYGDYIKYYKQDKNLAEIKKKNYIARHSVNENYKDPMLAGTLARYILWNKPTIEQSIKDFKSRFNLG